MKRLLGLDYGSRTVGLAATDPLGLTVQPLETVVRKQENKLRRTLARIDAVCRERGTEAIVIGLPLNMDDTEGERALAARRFGEAVAKRTGLPVFFEDERLTTVEADAILDETGRPHKNRKEVIDRVAAALILESYCSRREKEDG